MPSPLGHTLFSLSIMRVTGKEIFKNKFLLLTGLFFGLLPDIDLALIIVFGFKEGGKYHQIYTHSIFIVILTFIFLIFFSKNLRLSLLLSSLSLSHIILDIFSIDLKPPIGVPLFAPFSSFTLNFGILPKIEKSSLHSLFSWNNIKAMIIETLIFLPILIVSFYLTREKRNSPKFHKIS